MTSISRQPSSVVRTYGRRAGARRKFLARSRANQPQRTAPKHIDTTHRATKGANIQAGAHAPFATGMIHGEQRNSAGWAAARNRTAQITSVAQLIAPTWASLFKNCPVDRLLSPVAPGSIVI